VAKRWYIERKQRREITYHVGRKCVQTLRVSLVSWKRLNTQSVAELWGCRYPEIILSSWNAYHGEKVTEKSSFSNIKTNQLFLQVKCQANKITQSINMNDDMFGYRPSNCCPSGCTVIKENTNPVILSFC